MTRTREENAADLAHEVTLGQLKEEWRGAVVSWDTELGFDDWLEHERAAPKEPMPDQTTRYRVEGTVYLGDGFTFDIEAKSEDEARKIADKLAHDTVWSDASLNEVCIETVYELEGQTA